MVKYLKNYVSSIRRGIKVVNPLPFLLGVGGVGVFVLLVLQIAIPSWVIFLLGLGVGVAFPKSQEEKMPSPASDEEIEELRG